MGSLGKNCQRSSPVPRLGIPRWSAIQRSWWTATQSGFGSAAAMWLHGTPTSTDRLAPRYCVRSPRTPNPPLQCYAGEVNVGITCYPTYGGSGIVATELGLELASRMAEVAESYDLDILHVHYAIPHSISALLAQQMLAPVRRLPFITTLHGTDITLVGTDRSYFPITKFSMEKSDGITSISEYLRARTVDVFGVTNEIRVIQNFVNCDLYHSDDAKTGAAAYAPAGEKLLIPLSNFRPVKRVLDCIRILAEVRKNVPAHLLMVGDGPERSPAEHLARELKVDRHVSFLGKQDHVERLIPLAHVLLMPSDLESFGLVALEAMACGVVPVATRVGGVPELITHAEDGFLEAVGDVAAQSARVVALLNDEDLHYRMRKAGRWNAAERFCTDKIIPQYEKYYEDVLNR